MASKFEAVKLLLLKNLCKSPSVAEALFSTYVDLVHSSPESQLKEFEKRIMEPFVHNSLHLNQCSNIVVDTCDVSTTNLNEDFVYKGKMMQFDVGTLDLAYGTGNMRDDRYKEDKTVYRKMRKWHRLSNYIDDARTSAQVYKLRILSFNILAQTLLESYPYLYQYHDKDALPWNVRQNLIWEEIHKCNADIICLQEMQEEHLADFVYPFVKQNYMYLYKKRTHEKKDGLLLMCRKDKFDLIESTEVEYYRPGIELLSRDNVGLVAKFQIKDNPLTKFIVATTHLLYNPRREDVRLGQVQMLLSEVEKMSFVKYNERSQAEYLPIILSGDFNLEPTSGVYKFITSGYFKYLGKNRQLTSYRTDQYVLKNSLIPSYINVTDDCQRFDVLLQRLGITDERTEKQRENFGEKYNMHLEGQNVIDESTIIKLSNGYQARFATGFLTHPFNLRSLYSHKDAFGKREASTNQGSWITVDYIFYSKGIRPIEKYSLPNIEQCENLPTIPNFAVGSDHLCLGATFEIEKQN